MFTFTEDCRIGIEQIDREHEHLFDVLNQAFALLKAGHNQDRALASLLEELKQYAGVHFEHEEAYMKSIRDPEYERQHSQHEAFTEKVQEFYANLEDDGQTAALEEVLSYMTRWLLSHILGSDMMIGKLQPVEEWEQQEDPCAFTEQYYTGIPLVDEEHRHLFEIIGRTNELVCNEFIPDKFDNIIDLLEELKDYTKVHFADEERYMQEIGYEGLEAQKRAHAGFVDKLEEIEFEGFDGKQQETLTELMDFLFHWLSHHILRMDKLIPAS